ncbi:MAG TPA: DoxX family protein [Burkholderiales bacterium]|nr:DoxX family protein [Burkholderiales bacterium]
MIDSRTAPYGALLLRVALGLLFLAHGLLKVLVFTVPGTVKFFASIGYPGFVAYLVILAELGGGAALILGLWTRWIALILLVEMIGVIAFHFPHGWIFTAKGGGWEYPALWAVALLVLALLGNGAIAISGRSRARAGR